MGIAEEKQRLREKIWSEMEFRGIAVFPKPCRGRIPNFLGANAAAAKLCSLEEWKKAKVVFANPDSPQQRVRENVLLDGKKLIMASPRLKRGFILIDPIKVKGKERLASTIKGAFKLGAATHFLIKPDLIVEGSVAVDFHGHRLGKGRGYGDAEIQILKRSFGEIPIATTVHDIQVVNYVPFDEKDEKVSIIATPTRIIRVKPIN